MLVGAAEFVISCVIISDNGFSILIVTFTLNVLCSLCFRWLNLDLILGLDLFCLYLQYSRSLFCIKRFISEEVTHGCPSFGLQRFVRIFFLLIH